METKTRDELVAIILLQQDEKEELKKEIESLKKENEKLEESKSYWSSQSFKRDEDIDKLKAIIVSLSQLL